MKIHFIRTSAYVLSVRKLQVYVGTQKVADFKNGEEYLYDGPKGRILITGPALSRNLKIELEEDYDTLTIKFKPVMGILMSGYKAEIFHNDELIKKVRKAF